MKRGLFLNQNWKIAKAATRGIGDRHVNVMELLMLRDPLPHDPRWRRGWVTRHSELKTDPNEGSSAKRLLRPGEAVGIIPNFFGHWAAVIHNGTVGYVQHYFVN